MITCRNLPLQMLKNIIKSYTETSLTYDMVQHVMFSGKYISLLYMCGGGLADTYKVT